MGSNEFNYSKTFNGTAGYYSKYRPEYPQEMVDIVIKNLRCKKFDRMLDMGCGTGKVALAFHKYFKEIMATDINGEMIEEAFRVSSENKIDNIKWFTKPAEDVDITYGKFDLVTFGASFHWMNRDKVSKNCFAMLDKGGLLVILNFGRGFSKDYDWGKAVWSAIDRWAHKEEYNTPPNLSIPMMKDELSTLPFSRVEYGELQIKEIFDVETIIGYLYTTSYCNKNILGDNIEEFEKDIISLLYNINKKGVFQSKLTANYVLAEK